MRAILVVALVAFMPFASAQYNYDDYDFTEVLTDAVDNVGFYDFTSWSIAETGDGNLIFLVGQADNTVSGPAGMMVLRFTSGGLKAMGFTPTFAPTSQGAGDGQVPESCEAVSSTEVYCIVTYGAASAGIGTTLGAIQAASYTVSITDMAPEAWIGLGGAGTPYTLTGCTLKVLENCPVIEVPTEADIPKFYANHTTGFVADHTMGGEFYGEYIYNVSVASLPAFLNYTVDMTAGSVTLSVSDEFDEIVVAKIEAGFEDSISLDGFEGNWVVSAKFEGFVGNATYEMWSPSGMETGNGTEEPTGNGTLDDGNETADPDEGNESTPGLAIPLVALALVGIARRRLR